MFPLCCHATTPPCIRDPNRGVDVKWVPATAYPMDYLRVGNYEQSKKPIIGMEHGFCEQRMQLWRQMKNLSTTSSTVKGEL